MKRIPLIVCLFSLSPIIRADSLPVGTWVQRNPQQGTVITMTVEAVGAGRKLSYTFAGSKAPRSIMTIVTQLDGKDTEVLVDGKRSAETMAIRMIDSRHTFTVLKMQGKEMGTSKGEVSADGKVLKVENAMNGAEKAIEYWDKK